MIINGNALNLPIASNTIQCVVTSPPYFGLRDYGVSGQLGLEHTPEEYIANMVMVFREVWRVLKNDGTLWLNIGDSYAGSGKGGQSEEKRSQNWQPVYGAKGGTFGLKPKDLIGIPWMLAFALRADGWYLRSDIIWSKLNPMPESVKDRPTKSHEYLFLLSKNRSYYYNAEAIAEPVADSTANDVRIVKDGMLPRYGGKKYTENPEQFYRTKSGNIYDIRPLRNKWTVWSIATQPIKAAHFATFPEKLVEPCILAGSRPGDVVLDPFLGSGTVSRVALKHNRLSLGVDLNMDYIKTIAHKRTSAIQSYILFGEVEI